MAKRQSSQKQIYRTLWIIGIVSNILFANVFIDHFFWLIIGVDIHEKLYNANKKYLSRFLNG